MKLYDKITVYDDGCPVAIRVYYRGNNAPYEVRINDEFWSTCENLIEVDDEIKDIISLHHYNFYGFIF